MTIEERNYINGRMGAFMLYLVLGCIAVYLGGRSSNVGFWGQVCSALAFFLSLFLLLSLSPTRKQISWKNYMRMQTVFYIFLGFGIYYLTGDPDLLFFTFFVQSMVIFLFMDPASYFFQAAITAFSLALALFLGNMIEVLEPMKLPHFYGVICLVLVEWLSIKVIHNHNNQIRHALEQERGQDDTAKVLQKKCKEAKNAVRGKSDFMANMSHEIRTPINSILGMNEMIIREAKEDNIQAYAKDINNSGKALLSLIDNIMDYTLIETGKLELREKSYDLSALLNDLNACVAGFTEERNIELDFQVEESIPKGYYGDVMRIQQVLSGLLEIAIMLSKSQEIIIKISGRESGEDHLDLVFRLEGMGEIMDSATIEKLYRGFKKYEKALEILRF